MIRSASPEIEIASALTLLEFRNRSQGLPNRTRLKLSMIDVRQYAPSELRQALGYMGPGQEREGRCCGCERINKSYQHRRYC